MLNRFYKQFLVLLGCGPLGEVFEFKFMKFEREKKGSGPVLRCLLYYPGLIVSMGRS